MVKFYLILLKLQTKTKVVMTHFAIRTKKCLPSNENNKSIRSVRVRRKALDEVIALSATKGSKYYSLRLLFERFRQMSLEPVCVCECSAEALLLRKFKLEATEYIKSFTIKIIR